MGQLIFPWHFAFHGMWLWCRASLCTYLLDQRVPLKRKFVVIVEVRELLLGYLDSARAGDVVHTAFLEQVIQHVTLIVETGCPNFTAIIEQVHTEQFSLAIFVVPSLDVRLARATSFDCPLVGIGRDGLDGVDGGMGRGRGASRRLSSIGLLCWCTGRFGSIESVARNCRWLGLLFILSLDFERLGLSDLLCLAEFLQDLQVQDDQDSDCRQTVSQLRNKMILCLSPGPPSLFTLDRICLERLETNKASLSQRSIGHHVVGLCKRTNGMLTKPRDSFGDRSR